MAESDRDSAAFESHVTGLAKRVHTANVPHLGIAKALVRRSTLDLRSQRTRQSAPAFDVDRLRIVFGPHGARIEPLNDLETPDTAPARPQQSRTLPLLDVRAHARAAVWSELARNASVVHIAGGRGAGMTTLLHRLAAGARENGFSDGAIYLADVIGPAPDAAQRMAALLDPARRLRYYTASDRMRFTAGRRILALLDRAYLSAAAVADLQRALPNVFFVIADAPEFARSEAIALGPLSADLVLTLLEESYGRPIDEENRRVALDLCATSGSLPGPARLIGVTARVLQCSFISLSLRCNSGEAVVRELIAGLPATELRILSMLVAAGAPLAAHHIAYVVRSAEVRASLDHLVECQLIRAGGELFEVPHHAEHLVPPLADTDAALARIVDVICDVFDSWQDVAVLDCQLTATEALLRSAAQRSAWKNVLAVGPRAADEFAARGAFNAWGRVLDLVEVAAAQLGDAAALDLARHDQGVRAVLVGENERAAPYLASAARARRAAGDVNGADASDAALALAPGNPAPRCVTPSLESQREPPAPRRPLLTRSLLVLGFGIVALALIAFSLRYKPSAAPVIRKLSASPTTIAGGRSAQLCVDVTDAAVVEIFPSAVRLPAGKHCLNVQPAATTMYVAVGTAADGRQVRRAVTVAVNAAAAPPLRIGSFTVSPARVKAGGSARVCYAVTGAHELRIVPSVGALTRLRSCQTVTLREPHRYRYTLLATGDDGRVAIRQVHVDVVALAPQVPRAADRRKRNDRLIQRAVYQFDATPTVVERGQATSLCVGVDRPARGFVTHVGTLASGITRCYRVQPRATTVYRLYVALQDATAVQSVTVAVRPSTRKGEATHGERH